MGEVEKVAELTGDFVVFELLVDPASVVELRYTAELRYRAEAEFRDAISVDIVAIILVLAGDGTIVFLLVMFE